MDPDDHVCLCHKVSLRKLVHFLNRRQPSVPSQLSECLGAGTGCQWCVPFLRDLHEQWACGQEPALPVAPESYARKRAVYRQQKKQADEAAPDEGLTPSPPAPGEVGPRRTRPPRPGSS